MRKIIIILSGCSVVLLLAYSAYRGYGVWKQNHWLSLARQFAAKADTQNEFLALEEVLAANPRNLEACRMMANLAEAEHSKATVTWRKKILDLAPDSLNDRMAYAQSAMIAQDFATVATVLAGTDAAGMKTASYFNIAGQLALALNKPDEAQLDFAEAARLDPSDPSPLLSSAVIQLHRTNALDMAEARITLKRISLNATNMAVHNQAQRELTMDALHYKDYSTALQTSKELTQSTNAFFIDKLLRLDVLKASQSVEYTSDFNIYKHEAADNPVKVEQLTLWMMQRNMLAEALGWLRGLSANTQTNVPVAPLVARCEMLAQDWDGLRNSTAKQDWKEYEYLRHAFLSFALRQKGLSGASKAEWDVALKSADGQDAELTTLYRMTTQWNWLSEGQQILWDIVNAFPQEQWAAQDLASALYNTGSTHPLMQLFSVQVSRNPGDLDAKNNLALTALLLHANEVKPFDLALEVSQKVPTNTDYACTYAFALYLRGKSTEALKIMQNFTAQELNHNQTAGYYGLILKSVGDRSRAATYLKRSTTGPLLPEERALFEQAMTGM